MHIAKVLNAWPGHTFVNVSQLSFNTCRHAATSESILNQYYLFRTEPFLNQYYIICSVLNQSWTDPARDPEPILLIRLATVCLTHLVIVYIVHILVQQDRSWIKNACKVGLQVFNVGQVGRHTAYYESPCQSPSLLWTSQKANQAWAAQGAYFKHIVAWSICFVSSVYYSVWYTAVYCGGSWSSILLPDHQAFG